MEQISTKTANKQPLTFTDTLRITFKGVLDPIGAFMNRLGLMPNTMTLLGLAGNTIGALLIALGYVQIGGLVVLLMGPIDALDGTMARLRGMAGQFGAFVDSVTDRYSELVIFMGLLYYYARQDNQLAVMLVFAAAAGSVLVSYIRARGQSLGWDTKVGILTRVERYLVLAPALIVNYPIVGLWIIAIFSNLTAIQRIIDVRRQAYQNPTKEQ
ncbi:MAG: CDP-alcohol phosphatidyltransferase family protein [Anaerolineales bacterium]|nr:CDP-alcohol phosphatidyltransferase family protein [Anaerolineales bacterium]